MTVRQLSKLELRIMDALWSRGPASVREVQETFPKRIAGVHDDPDDDLPPRGQTRDPPGQEDQQRAHFRGRVSRIAAHRRIIDDLLSVFGGRTQPVMAHLIEAGKLTLDDLREAEGTLRRLSKGSIQ